MILATGATGFIGHALVARLLAKGRTILARVRVDSTGFSNIVQQVVIGYLSVLADSLSALTILFLMAWSRLFILRRVPIL